MAKEYIEKAARKMINCKNCKTDCANKGDDRSLEYCGGMIELTNADRIRAMSDEELAKEFERGCPPGKDYISGNCDASRDCYPCLLDWLRSPAEASP